MFCIMELYMIQTWYNSGWWSRFLDSSPFHKEASSSHHCIRLELQGDCACRTSEWIGQSQTTECPNGIVMNTGSIKYLFKNKDWKVVCIHFIHTPIHVDLYAICFCQVGLRKVFKYGNWCKLIGYFVFDLFVMEWNVMMKLMLHLVVEDIKC